MTSDNLYAPDPGATNVDGASAKQQATDTARMSKDAAADVASSAADQAKDVARQTQEQARDLLGRTKSQVNEQVVAQQGAVVESLRSLGDQLAEMTDHVEHPGTATDLAAKSRDRARGAADWLDGREPGEVLDELRRVGRNKPGAFLLGAALAGVAAGRLTRGVAAVHTDDTDDNSTAAHRADGAESRPQPAIGVPDTTGGPVTRP